jgi:Arrestin (or S-antigen), C-terminal domain
MLSLILADRPDEKPHRRCTVRMGIRVLQRCPVAVGHRGADSPPRASIEKSFMLSDGRVRLEAVLDRAHYRQGEPVHVKLSIHNHSRKTVRRIKVTFAILRSFFFGGAIWFAPPSKNKKQTHAYGGQCGIFFIAFHALTLYMFRT